MKQLNKKEEEQLKQAFDAICNMYYATEKDNFSKCSAFHIKPFNNHWDKKTVKELMYGLKLYIGSWVISPMEEALKMSRYDVEKEEKKRSRESKKWKKEWLESRKSKKK